MNYVKIRQTKRNTEVENMTETEKDEAVRHNMQWRAQCPPCQDFVFDIETTGLDPIEHRVIAIGFKSGLSEEFVMTSEDEKHLLTEFWELIRAIKPQRFIGFNNWSFDMPFLIIRSFYHDVAINYPLYGKIVDLRLVLWFGQKYNKGKLQDFAKMVGLSKTNGLSGEEAPKLWSAGKVKELISYTAQDVKVTGEIYQRAKKLGIL